MATQQVVTAGEERGTAVVPLFDWLMTGLSLLFIGGIYLDGWAHRHGRVDESFFTPWHAVMYGAFGLLAAYLGGTAWRRFRRGEGVWPEGYALTAFGVVLFAAGGFGDMVWHTLLGIESGVEVLFSPTHLLLAAGGAFIATGPWRAAWRRAGQQVAPLTAVLSLTLLVLTIQFMTMYGWFLAQPVSATSEAPPLRFFEIVAYYQAAGGLGIIVHSAVLAGALLLALRRWTLPLGSVTLLILVTSLGGAVLGDTYRFLPVLIVAGLAGDGLLAWLRPAVERPGAWRLFGFAVPFLYYLGLQGQVWLIEGTWWAPALWTGTVVKAGLAGLLVAYVMAPPGVGK